MPGGKVALTNHRKMGLNPSSKQFNIQRHGKSRHGRQGIAPCLDLLSLAQDAQQSE